MKVWFKEFCLAESKYFLSYTFIFRKQFYFIASDLKIIGYENPDNNLE
jgi:hypothetical protein